MLSSNLPHVRLCIFTYFSGCVNGVNEVYSHMKEQLTTNLHSGAHESIITPQDLCLYPEDLLWANFASTVPKSYDDCDAATCTLTKTAP